MSEEEILQCGSPTSGLAGSLTFFSPAWGRVGIAARADEEVLCGDSAFAERLIKY